MALMAQRDLRNATNATCAKCQLNYFYLNVVSIQKSCIFTLRNKQQKQNAMTSLQNQIAKLSKVELAYFNLLNNKGITGEEALNHVLIASATGLLK